MGVLQEKEIELEYIRKMADRLEKEVEQMYEQSPSGEASMYGHVSSQVGYFDFQEEARLKELAFEWITSDASLEYKQKKDRLEKITWLKDKLEKDQEDYVIHKYNVCLI